MQRDELLTMLRKRPFVPFRVCLVDGRSYEIRQPDMNLLANTFMTIGIPEPDVADPFPDHSVMVGLDEIARVEPCECTATLP